MPIKVAEKQHSVCLKTPSHINAKYRVVPQFVLDSLITTGHGSAASIIITQPRRLSAIGVATRVSAERLEDGSVGYAIRGESKQNNRTKLLFCTTGVVLRRLSSGDRLGNATHVIVDEVRELLIITLPADCIDSGAGT